MKDNKFNTFITNRTREIGDAMQYEYVGVMTDTKLRHLFKVCDEVIKYYDGITLDVDQQGDVQSAQILKSEIIECRPEHGV